MSETKQSESAAERQLRRNEERKNRLAPSGSNHSFPVIHVAPKHLHAPVEQVSIRVHTFALGSTSVQVLIDLKDKAGNLVGRKSMPLPKDVVAAWGTDDKVVENYVLNELGLQPVEN